MESENKKIDLGINAILKKKFPDFKIKNHINQEVKEDTIEIIQEAESSALFLEDDKLIEDNKTTFTFGNDSLLQEEDKEKQKEQIDLFNLTNSNKNIENEYEKIYIQKLWQDLLNKTNEDLKEDKNNYLAKTYWIEANFNLKIIPPEILLGTLDGLETDVLRASENIEIRKVIARTYFNISKRLKDKPELVMTSLSKASEIDATVYRSAYKQFVKTEYLRLDKLSDSLPQNDPVFEKLNYLKNLSQELEIDLTSRKEKHNLIEFDRNTKKRKRKFFILIIILISLIFGLYLSYQALFQIPEQKIPLSSKDIDNFDNLINLEIDLPKPEPLELIESITLDDLIKEANKDIEVSDGKDLLDSSSTKEIKIENKVKEKLNLKGPREPKELTDLLEGRVTSQPGNSDQQANKRPPFIVRGDSKRDPIVSGGSDFSVPETPSEKKIVKVGEEVFSLINTSLYSRPNLQEAELQEIKRNQPMLVIGNFGEWFQVKLRNGRIGYVKKDWVEP